MNRIEPPPPDIGVELSMVLPTHGQAADEGHSGFAWLGSIIKKLQNRITNATVLSFLIIYLSFRLRGVQSNQNLQILNHLTIQIYATPASNQLLQLWRKVPIALGFQRKRIARPRNLIKPGKRYRWFTPIRPLIPGKVAALRGAPHSKVSEGHYFPRYQFIASSA
ncbi:MAG: hypothetical protein RL193_75 [Actinomycetota bacterium]|jgi:hypothetical protein